MKTFVGILSLLLIAITWYYVIRAGIEVFKNRREAAKIRLHKKILSHFKQN